ncbi:MAG: glycosyltransferase family 2 protein [Ktedonobacteraceae bacterium]|nr:glycosyltransferase family 2 protein [Ktedonobacteraceae bacterium]
MTQVPLAYSLSVILPAHNEEQAIAETVSSVCATLAGWTQEFEVIVVNDGSVDNTGAILAGMAQLEPHLRIITHPINQGYGAALVSGFEAVSKDLAFFMDSDGQFDIQDLALFFPYLAEYDAVLGYRIQRQDAWVRKLNAWGWKQVVRIVLDVHVRDLDCAFKLYRAEFLQRHRFETRGAMINAEMLYKFTSDGYTFKEVGVRHLPRKGGQATGANLKVVLRAFRELLTYARKWRREEQAL